MYRGFGQAIYVSYYRDTNKPNTQYLNETRFIGDNDRQ
jgi:hypothetical protein